MRHLTAHSWACSEQLYDCHREMGRYQENKEFF